MLIRFIDGLVDATMLFVVAAIVAVFVLAGCSPQEPPKTVAYYTANPTERDGVIARCKDNPGQLKDSPDCVNATESQLQGWGKKTLPPVGFGPKPTAPASN